MRLHRLRLPARAVHSHGVGDVGVVETILLELTDDEGRTGWGEASPWAVFTGTIEANLAALHIHMRERILGADASATEAMLADFDRTVMHCSEAKAALETAMLDLLGQRAGLSIGQLLGGCCHAEIPLSFSVANPDFAADLDTVAALFADGVRLFKMKTGFADHAFDAMRLEKLRGVYGDALDLRIDYNQGMRAHEAIPRLRDLERFRPTFFEQPVPRTNLEAMAAITQAIDTPILADESVFNPREALVGAQMRIADLFSLKIMKSGGMRRALEVAAIARAAGIGVYGGCMFETGIAHAAGAHLMAAIPDLTLGCEFYMSTYYLAEDILADPFPVRAGKVIVPQGPGLGVTVDRARLARYTVETLG
ncbi:MAG: cycloisomerase [Rhodospirillales bacterium]|nr:cycloisomerase [Rhodospirillales bacterium]